MPITTKIRTVLRGALAAGFLLGSVVPPAEAANPDLRINVVKGVRQVSLAAKNLSVWDSAKGTVLWRSRSAKPVVISWRDLGLTVDSQAFPTERLTVRAEPQIFRFGQRSFRGEFEVVRSEGKGLTLVNRLPLEDYLVGLINHEISSSWPIESIKAQAVVARTYALYRKMESKYVDYDLESSVLDQVYGGTDLEDDRSRRAVLATAGEVLMADGEVIAAFYHSCCGGQTEIPQYVWGGNYAGLSSVSCEYCSDAPSFFWRHRMTVEALREALIKQGETITGQIRRVRIYRASPHGRVLSFGVTDDQREVQIPGNQLRSIVGFQNLRSTFFRLETTRSDGTKTTGGEVDGGAALHFVGSGSGHGVGMCQWGARGMAEEGKDYRAILRHYYPIASLRTVSRLDSKR